MEQNLASPVSLQPNIPQQRNILKILFKIFLWVVAVSVVVAGGITFIVLRVNPEKVVQSMMAGIASARTSEINTNFSFDLDLKDPIKNPYVNTAQNLPEEIKKIGIKINTLQASDISSENVDGGKYSATIDGDISINDKEMLKASFETRLVNKHLYGHLARLNVEPVGLAIEQTKWFDLDMTATSSPASSLPLNFSMPASPNLTPAQISRMREVFAQSRFLKIKEKKGIEWVGMVPMHHYIFTIDAHGFTQYLNEISKISGIPNVTTTATDPTTPSVVQIQKTIDQVAPEGDIWITVFGQLPYRVYIPISLDSLFTIFDMPSDGSVSKSSITMTAVSMNKLVTIDVPDKIMPMEEFLKPFTDSLGSARLKGQDAQVKSSLSNLRAIAELWYDSNGMVYSKKAYPLQECSNLLDFKNNNFFSDKRAYDALGMVYNASGINSARCIVTPRAWATVAKLPGGGNQNDNVEDSWCVDSRGASKGYKFSTLSKLATLVDVIDQQVVSCR